ncbi:hypothetical protein [Halorubrum sp. AS12]|uniref:transcriptional regulator FilR1 domain-containing protein n=1 Tax=Halorubrum sp. AS12 TaxID=3409687 RepID=UPI003DA6E6D8
MASSTGNIVDVVLKRQTVLEYICQCKPDKRTLVENLSESRPTINRAVRELEDLDLVERVDGVCKPTYTGQTAYNLCKEFTNSFQMLQETSPELSSLPLDAELDKSIFLGGSVFHPPDYAPYERIQPLDNDLRNGEKIVAATEILIPHIDEILRQGTDGDADITLFVSNDVLDVLLDNQPDRIIPHIESGDGIYRGIEISRYSLFLIDDEILYTGIYSDTNHLSAVIRNTNQQVIQWAKESISELEDEGTLLTA